MKMHNFCAGPSILPKVVTEQLARSVVDHEGMGLSLLELSHRSDTFVKIISEAKSLLLELMGLDAEEYETLYLTGGASTQFYQVPFNLLNEGQTAAYLDTGRWSAKAIKEAKHFGNVAIVGSAANSGYDHIPKADFSRLEEPPAYLHITTNNTVSGSQIHEQISAPCPIVADMSSDILSKPMGDLSGHGLIYAGAQKNIGPAGTTIVIVKKSLLGKVDRAIPTMIDYRTHVKNLMFNTPPVISIYGCLLTLRWVKEQGLEQIQKNNAAKAALLYEEIDRNPLFRALVKEGSRSLMNVTFDLVEGYADRSESFLQLAAEAGCMALAGHRSVGGFRASLYNALPLESVAALVEVMQAFTAKHG